MGLQGLPCPAGIVCHALLHKRRGACPGSCVLQDKRRAGSGRPTSPLNDGVLSLFKPPAVLSMSSPGRFVCALPASVKAGTLAAKRTGRKNNTRHTESETVVPFAWFVPVAGGRAEILCIV